MSVNSTILFISICLFYSCLEIDDFEVIRENQANINLTNPIRFDQLAVGQKSTYVLIKPGNCGMASCCQQYPDTLQVEIIEQDTNGYLVKETTTLSNSVPFFFYLKHEIRQLLRDTIENEPSVEEYDELVTVKTEAIDEAPSNQCSALYNLLGARLYLQILPNKSLVPLQVKNTCNIFFLPEMKDDLLPFTDDAYHSELGITKDYNYEHNFYGDLLLSNHDYGFSGDGINFTYGYSLEVGLVFSGTFLGRIQYGAPAVWHIVPEN